MATLGEWIPMLQNKAQGSTESNVKSSAPTFASYKVLSKELDLFFGHIEYHNN